MFIFIKSLMKKKTKLKYNFRSSWQLTTTKDNGPEYKLTLTGALDTVKNH